MIRFINIYKELINLSLPILLSSMISTIISIASIPILGNYSVESMAASASYASITMIFSNILLASFTGYRILGSKALGANNLKLVSELFSNTVYLTFSVSLILGGILLIFSNAFASLMSREDDVLMLTASFLKIGAIAYPLMAITNSILISFALQKQTKIPMYINILSDVLGIFLSVCLVFGYLNFPKLGPIGIVWASLTQATVACFLALVLFNANINKIQFHIAPCLTSLRKLFSLSHPMMLSMLLDYLGNFIMFAMIGYFLGKDLLAAGRLGFTLILLYFSIIAAMSSGFMILGGRALGINDSKKFVLYNNCNRKLSLVIAFLLAIPLIVMPDYILMIFTSFEEVRKAALIPIIAVAISTFFTAWSYSNASYLRLLEKVKIDMVCNMVSLWLIQIPMAFYLGVYLDLKLLGFFIAFLLYESTYAISTYYFVKKYTINKSDVSA